MLLVVDQQQYQARISDIVTERSCPRRTEAHYYPLSIGCVHLVVKQGGFSQSRAPRQPNVGQICMNSQSPRLDELPSSGDVCGATQSFGSLCADKSKL